MFLTLKFYLKRILMLHELNSGECSGIKNIPDRTENIVFSVTTKLLN